MRITQQVVQKQALQHIQSNFRALATAQEQVSSGRAIRKASDDPTAAGAVMRAGSELRGLDQYRRNIDAGLIRVNAEETVLGQLGDALVRARELAVAQGGDTASATTRLQTKGEVDKLLEFAVQLANTRISGGYLFGGHRVDEPPVQEDLSVPVDPDEQHRVEIASGQHVATNHNAHEVFAQTGALQALAELSRALGDDDGAGVRVSLTELEGAFEGVQTLLGEIGGRQNQLELTRDSLNALSLDLRTLKSELEDIDLAEALIEVSGREAALQAAMLSTSRILGMSLVDFLR